ncbi:MAG: 16S rRNA (cytosine(1402)-N(4))-methyltransferase RsmH [Actinomycetota bacterium]|nr:16S rRNA (cytosine(1402)-N(4))-methyltransferase RsmH [Actinomycetota bacterium]
MSDKDVVVDATTGAGGHAEALLEAGVRLVIGMDRDSTALDEAVVRLRRFGSRFRPVHSLFSKISDAVGGEGLSRVGGVLFDLGVSSMQLDRENRGFSYRTEGPLDMRMGGQADGPTAADVVNSYPEDRLISVITEYGEERFGRRIAAAIVRARAREPITSTTRLAAIVAGAVPRTRRGPHPARRTFQALRLEVNRELEELTASLPQAVNVLDADGRLVVISYHSLEDRIAKRFFKQRADLSVLTSKPIRPSPAEVAVNPRARSAKLRAAEKRPEAA